MKNNSFTEKFLVQTGDWSTLKVMASKIRYEVFVVEQNVPVELEMDDKDEHCIHVVIFENKSRPVATGRLDQNGKIGRMAITPDLRGYGLGVMLLKNLLQQAVKLDLKKVYCHAQEHAIGFYKKMDFIVRGQPFIEAGISHQRMEFDIHDSDNNTN